MTMRTGPARAPRALAYLPTIITALAALAAGSPAPLAAQEPLGGRFGWQVGPTVEQWSFGCCSSADAQSSVKSATEVSLPVVAVVPIGRSVTLDAYAAWVRGNVMLRDAASTKLSVNGLTDTKLRASVRLRGDALLATFGVNAPTGTTGLDGEELSAMRVLGAPALRFATPALGTGWGGTTGLVYTTRLGGWSWGAGASYEYRGRYAPAQAEALGLGAGEIDLRPGQAIRLSVGADGLVGQSAMALSLASTFYTKDRVSLDGGPAPEAVTLGPMFTAEWRWRMASPIFRELSVFAFDRYRTAYHRGGETVDGTSGNELEAGAQGSLPLSPRLSLVAGVNGRHHTGLSVDNSLATAAVAAGGLDVGLEWETGAVSLRPTIGAMIGRMDTGGQKITVHELQASFHIGAR